MAPFLHRGDEGIFSSMTELIVPSYLNCQHGGESAAAHYQALLSDSPWGLCLQHCLAFKHTCICQVLSSVPVSNSYKPLPRWIFPVQTGMFAGSSSLSVPSQLLHSVCSRSSQRRLGPSGVESWNDMKCEEISWLHISIQSYADACTERERESRVDDIVSKQMLYPYGLLTTHVTVRQCKQSTSWQYLESLALCYLEVHCFWKQS